MSKNLLQELCQSRKYALPKYISTMVGPSHAPVWSSMVEIQTPDHLFLFDELVECRTKKEAEESVAKKALAKMSSGGRTNHIPLFDPLKPPIRVKGRVVLLVDVENLPKLISQLPETVGHLDIFAFVGKHHPLAVVDFESLGATTVISPSTRPDGTDTCMGMWVGAFLANEEYDQYLIATRDHFGSALVDLITEDCQGEAIPRWVKRKAVVVTTVEHTIEALR